MMAGLVAGLQAEMEDNSNGLAPFQGSMRSKSCMSNSNPVLPGNKNNVSSLPNSAISQLPYILRPYLVRLISTRTLHHAVVCMQWQQPNAHT